MKKRGFTLIELLAVIVVLAIIALIATPIVMNVIKKANEGAAERSADNYVKAVETLIATEKLDGTPLVDGTYTIDSTGKLTKDGKEYEVEVSGTKPVGGTVVITNGQVVKGDTTTIEYEDYTVKYPNGKAEAGEKGDTLVLCKAIKPVEQLLYTEQFGMTNVVVGQKATSDAPYATGAVYSCDLGETEDTKGLIFYVLKEDGDNIKLIMDRNLEGKATWCDQNGSISNNSSCNADGAIAHLNLQTTGWTKLFEAGGTTEIPVEIPNIPYIWMVNLSHDTAYWLSVKAEDQGPDATAIAIPYGTAIAAVTDSWYVRPIIVVPKTSMKVN